MPVAEAEWLKSLIRDIPDFPRQGIVFKDITPLLANREAFSFTVRQICEHFSGDRIDKVLGIEARGFIFAAPAAVSFGAGFVPVRKPGKLPHQIEREEYELEYGTDLLEIHRDAVSPGERVLIVDDVVATGGTAAATCRLVEKLGGEIAGVACVVELGFLKGRDRIEGVNLFSLISY